jgi:predicted ATPase/DNA-binding XRE family transcriptional regulator
MDVRSTVMLEGFGERLRQLRSAAGISQDELARRSGLSTAGVGALERGVRRAPQPETIALLAEALSLGAEARADLEQAAQRGRARSRTPSPDALPSTHNLPLQLTSFVGRAKHIEQIRDHIESSRLVTVVGSGGVGKTRVALEVAVHLTVNDGEEVRFVDLAPLQDETFITGRIAGVLGIRLSGPDDTLESLAKALHARRVLLVLDNCEHLIVGATENARVLLQRCPHVKILATSRERLGIMGEVVYRLPPMTLPDASHHTIEDARSSSALELFLQRAHLADPDFTFTDEQVPLLIDVCRRVDGIPLAIELAAARLPTLGLETLSRRLEATFGAARGTRGVPDRQQTMRDTIAWSYDLLTEPGRSLLRRLGIFAGGCTLEAAEAVCSGRDLHSTHVAGVLASLVDKSLVNAVIDGERMRYVLLDSTRAFARERLTEAEEQAALSRSHAQWLAAYGRKAGEEYLSQSNLIWLSEFLPEIDNVRSAIEWALRSGLDDDVLLAGKIAGSFRGLWLLPGEIAECRRWITLVLGRIDEKQQPLVVADLLAALAQTLVGSELLSVFNRLIIVLRHVDDRLRLAHALVQIAVRYCQNGLLSKAQDAIDEARVILAEERMLESPSVRAGKVAAQLWFASSELSFARGQLAEARANLEEATALYERFEDQHVLHNLLVSRAEIEFVAGDTSLAAKLSEQAVKRADTTPRVPGFLARALCVDAGIRLSTSDIRGGEAAARRAFSVLGRLGNDWLQLLSLQNLAATAIGRGLPQTGARLLGCIEAWREAAEYHRSPFEQATFRLLVASLHAELGADTETHIAEGRRLDLEHAIEEVLSVDFDRSGFFADA